ncbi:MAG TPA: AMP-binding protein [Thermoanaerobaculia bacterium]|jgi:acyl-CoA synthetase (AMP-forming)/AMP-acid ligase II|nr:AMP-binding protein [Thermoanaerobaculia bacterium]
MPPSPDHNVLSVLRRVAARVPERRALVMAEGANSSRISFGELWQRIDRVSTGLRRLGLAPGDRAIVMIPMSIDLYVGMLAVLEMGAVAVFVDPWIGRRQIASFAAFASPRAWLGIPKSHLLRLTDARLRSIPFTVTTGWRLGPFPGRLTLAELERAVGDGKVHPVERDDPALITFTSGSSGEPKGANRTHRFLLAQHEALAAEFPAREGDVDMPMFPVFALNNLASGVPSVVPAMDFRRVDRVDAGRVLAQMHRHGVTTCTASPPFFDRIATELGKGGKRPALRRILTGGAPVSDAQLRDWRRAFPESEILVVYGSTEAEPVAHLTAEERLSASGLPGFCAGRPSERVRAKTVRIHDGPIELGPEGWAGWELPAGEIGELVVSGDHVCRDYYQNPKAVRENKIVDPDGGVRGVWHRMGDTGFFDPEGRFWIAGRVHSTIRRGGEMVHPQLVEQAAKGEDPRVRRAAAVGLPDPELGERVVVVIETAEHGLEDEVKSRLLRIGFPADEILSTQDPLPVDPRHNSKIDYGKLRILLSKPPISRRQP